MDSRKVGGQVGRPVDGPICGQIEEQVDRQVGRPLGGAGRVGKGGILWIFLIFLYLFMYREMGTSVGW